MQRLTHADYTVAWICALPLELAAAKLMLNEVHESLPSRGSDHNAYSLGSISGHNVAIACLPHGVYGKVAAATVISHMLSTFPEIQFGLMVGIGGGVPSETVDIRLGDVVISKPTGTSSGVIQYDYGKTLREGKFQRTGSLDKPHPILLTSMSQIASDATMGCTQFEALLAAAQEARGEEFPRPTEDWLFQPTYAHQDGTQDCSTCDESQLIPRAPRETDVPFLHYGAIASGDQVMKDAMTRDSIANEFNVLCFEMEAAGLMDQLRPLVIRGVCDYCDSHKKKEWQRYAALAAAAYARVLLSVVPVLPVVNVDMKLREYYETNNRLGIKRLSGDLLDMEQCYINLSIIHKDCEIIKWREESYRFSLLDILTVGVSSADREITLPELFNVDPQPDGTVSRPGRILVRGRAGVGKTTLCKKIVHDFLHQGMWGTLFDRIIWIPLRRLKEMSGLDEFFRQEYFSFQAEPGNLVSALRKVAFDQTHQRTLWLLDGLDEISGYRNSCGIDLTEIFISLFNQNNVIITSRLSTSDLCGLHPFDLELEVVGLDSSQVETYLTKVMPDQTTADEIRHFIHSRGLIDGLVRIPILLDALCYTWDNDFHLNAIPDTMTAIYRGIELKLWKKDILQLEKRKHSLLLGESTVRKLRTFPQIQSYVGPEIEFLECLAFTGLDNGTIEFNQGYRDWMYGQPEFCEMSDDVLDRLSFLRTSDLSSCNKGYHFLHLSFQELFAAQYFVRCCISTSSERLLCLKPCSSGIQKTARLSPKEYLQRRKYSARFDVFWRFVTGLLGDYNEEQLCTFFDTIEGEPRDLLGPAHQRLLMHCVSEIPQLKLEDSPSLRRIRDQIEFRCIQWTRYEYRRCGEIFLCREMEYPEPIARKLFNEQHIERSDLWKVEILYALGCRSYMSSNLIHTIADYLHHPDEDIREEAAHTLRSQTALPQDVRNALPPKSESNKKLRLRGAREMGWVTPAPQETLNSIVSQLHKYHEDVRQAVLTALRKESKLPQGILDVMLSQLENDHGPVLRQEVLDSLANQSALRLEILNAVVAQLNDHDGGVRSQALYALVYQSNLPREILDAVVSQLDHRDADVRRKALFALTYQTLPGDILDAVVSRLEDDSVDVRSMVLNPLKKQLNLPPEILSSLVAQLTKDGNMWLHISDVLDTFSKQPSLPLDILFAIACQVKHLPPENVTEVASVLWKHDEFLDVFPNIDVDNAFILCRVWAQQSMKAPFACYIQDGVIHFETSGRRRLLFLCAEQRDIFKMWLENLTIETADIETILD